MAIHSRILAGRIPWTEEPGGLSSMRWHRVRHYRSNSTHKWSGITNSTTVFKSTELKKKKKLSLFKSKYDFSCL